MTYFIKGFLNLIVTVAGLGAFIAYIFVRSCESFTFLSLVQLSVISVIALLLVCNVVGKEKINQAKNMFVAIMNSIKPIEDGIVDRVFKHPHSIYCMTFIIVLAVAAVAWLVSLGKFIS